MAIANAAKAISNIAKAFQNNPALAAGAASAKNTAQSQDFAREQMEFQQASNEQAMFHSAQEAQKNRDWQEYMSNTAHQREVKDLLAAGLNPVLSANAGAVTPSGSTGQGYSSSGASGQVDNSYVNAIANIYSQELARQTNLDIARINQRTQLETAKLGYDASLATANISAATQRYVNQQQISYQEDNPQTMYGTINRAYNKAVDKLGNAITNMITGKRISNFLSSLSDFQKNIKPIKR